MSTVPFWFDSNAYIKNKAAVMGMDTVSLLAAFKNAGFGTDADGLYSHFSQFGNDEKVSPNAFFDSSQYLYTKAAHYYGNGNVTDQQAKSIDLAMNQNGMSPWNHFQKFWAENYSTEGTFYNPSATFDTTKYMNDKLAQMQKTDPNYTMDQLVQAFKDTGLDPVSHYLVAGQSEGLTPQNISTGTPGNTYQLTRGDDELYGTRGDDYFYAKVGTLGDNDYIDGGAGNNTLYANIKAEGDANTAIAPEITNVQNIIFRAQGNTTDGGGDNNSKAFIDAGNITGMKVLGNDNSRASLTVEDVRTNSNELTVRMSDTDPGNVDFSVYFDPQHLKANDAVTSGTLFAELIDTIGALPPAQGGNSNPLWDNPYTGFSFTLNGKTYTLDFGAYNHTTSATPSYDELAAQMQQAIDDDPELSALGLVVKPGSAFNATVGIGPNQGTIVTGNQIEISSDQGALGQGNWIAANGLPPTNSTSATFDSDVDVTCPLIMTNVELDNVGRVQWDDASACLPDDAIYGSQAGDLVIGSMAGRGGIERFDVTVDRGSWLSSMSSTNNTLREVNVKNGDVNGDGKNSNGNLFIGDSLLADGTVDPSAIDLGHWMNAPRLLSTDGLTDVKNFDASEMVGKVNIGAQITSDSYDKYLKDVDGANNMGNDYAPDGAFSYKLGSNDDTLNMVVDGGVAADQDFVLNIDAGAGNDLVNFRFDFNTVNQHLNQVAQNNVNIDLGTGNDTLWTWGTDVDGTYYAGSVNVLAGAGDDAVYLAQNAVDPNAVWVFNADVAGTARAIDVTAVGGAQPLSNDALGTMGVFNYNAGSTAGAKLQVTVTFKGISVTVDVATLKGTAGSVSAQTINEAIANAINNDPVLSKLLVAKDGAGYSLLVESLINGEMAAGDLTIAFGADSGAFGWGANSASNWYGSTHSGFAVDNFFDLASVTTQEGTAALPEIQTLTLTGLTIDQSPYTIIYNGIEYTTGAPATADAAGLLAALNAALLGVATVTEAGGVLTITNGANGDISNDTRLVNANVNGLGNGPSAPVNGSNDGTVSVNRVDGGAGDDVIVLNANDALGIDSYDVVALSGAHFGNDVVMNFTTGADKFDISSYGVINDLGAGFVQNAALNGTTSWADKLAAAGITSAAGKNIIFVENTDTGGVNDYYVFLVDAAGNTVAGTDNVTLLGTVNTGTDTIVGGDINFTGV